MLTRTRCLVIPAVVAAACSSNIPSGGGSASNPSTDTAAVKAVIEAANGRFLDAFKRGDKAGMMPNFADDAVVMMPNEEAWRGREGLDKGFSGFLSQMSFKEGGATTTDVMVAGDLAVETGTFAWTLAGFGNRNLAARSKTGRIQPGESDRPAEWPVPVVLLLERPKRARSRSCEAGPQTRQVLACTRADGGQLWIQRDGTEPHRGHHSKARNGPLKGVA